MSARNAARRMDYVEMLSTDRLLAMHERLFAPLDPVGRARMLATARAAGWDRAWDVRLAA